jgi:phage baseplate assembly protein W
MPNYYGFSTYNRIRKYKLTDFELVKQDLFNHFHIRKGEKLMTPNFGTLIWDIIYEPFTDAVKDLISDDVTKVVKYDPRLSVENIIVTEFVDGVMIDLTLKYVPTNEVDTLYLKFDRESRELSAE